MDEKTMLTIIETLAKALDEEKMLREYYENRVMELEERGERKNG